MVHVQIAVKFADTDIKVYYMYMLILQVFTKEMNITIPVLTERCEIWLSPLSFIKGHGHGILISFLPITLFAPWDWKHV